MNTEITKGYMDDDIKQLEGHFDDRFHELETHMDFANVARGKLETKLDKLCATKQDKLPKGSLVGIVGAVVFQIILIAFMWGSQAQQLSEVTNDRYRGSEATRDLALVGQRDNNIETNVLNNSVTLKELRVRIRKLETDYAASHPE